MNAITIRNLSEEASRALEARAARNGTTAEAEAEHILNSALTDELAALAENLHPDETGMGLGTALRKLAEKYPELNEMEFPRDQSPARFVSFE